jgi:Tol biopolymer transport system component
VGDGTVRTLATGRAFLRVSAGVLRDSAGVSVVPPGRLLAIGSSGLAPGAHGRMYLFDTDGAGYRAVNSAGWAPDGGEPYFMPDGRVVHHDVANAGSSDIATIRLADTTGGGGVLVAPDAAIGRALYPQPTRDGAWIYFTALQGAFGSAQFTELWRVRPDGTGLARVRAAGPMWTQYGAASPSPTGDRLAVLRSHQDGSGGTTLELLDLGTGDMRTIFTGLAHPRWSPVADEVAAYARGVSVIRTDGSVAAVTPQSGERGYELFDFSNGHLDWSPDGQWIVACIGSGSSSHALALVSRATGEVLPLAFTRRDGLCHATWRPA